MKKFQNIKKVLKKKSTKQQTNKPKKVEKKAIKMLAMSSLMMPVPMLGASQLVHKPPEAKLLAIHSAAAAAHSQPQATPQHHLQQPNHMQQQPQQQQSKPGRYLKSRDFSFLPPLSRWCYCCFVKYYYTLEFIKM